MRRLRSPVASASSLLLKMRHKECNIDSCEVLKRNAVRREVGGVICLHVECCSPEAEVVREKEERGNGCAGGEQEDFEGHLFGGGKGAVLDAICALEFCNRSQYSNFFSSELRRTYHSTQRTAAVCTCQR